MKSRRFHRKRDLFPQNTAPAELGVKLLEAVVKLKIAAAPDLLQFPYS
jgi:hypothetical protein